MIPALLAAIETAVSAIAAIVAPLQAKLGSLLTQSSSQSLKLDQIIAAQKQAAAAEHAEAQAISDHLSAFERAIDEILAAVVPSPTASIEVLITKDGQTSRFYLTGEPMQQSQFKDTDRVFFTLANPKDKAGQPSQIDPSKTIFSIDNPAIATLIPNSALDAGGNVVPGTSGLQCVVDPLSVGTATISGTVTDLTNPNDVIPFQGQISILGGDTATIDVQFSSPVAKPQP